MVKKMEERAERCFVGIGQCMHLECLKIAFPYYMEQLDKLSSRKICHLMRQPTSREGSNLS